MDFLCILIQAGKYTEEEITTPNLPHTQHLHPRYTPPIHPFRIIPLIDQRRIKCTKIKIFLYYTCICHYFFVILQPKLGNMAKCPDKYTW